MLPLTQVDVFTDEFMLGNPVAVVHDATGVTDEQMAAFARWTNLSETTFLLPPTTPDADYRLRIFTTTGELPFAGHPTLGSARAWLAAGGSLRTPGRLVQECGAGLVPIRLDGDRLAFAAPPLRRGGPVGEDDLASLADALGIPVSDVVGAAWADNGPGWAALQLASAEAVLALEPSGSLPPLGVIGAYPAGGPADFEVRAFYGSFEDPVTGSLNAGIAQWLVPAGLAPSSYVVSQGTRLQRRGRVHVDQVGDDLWIGGATVLGVQGAIALP